MSELLPLEFYPESIAGDPVLDTAVSHALLREVAGGERVEGLRLYRPDAVVLFSLLDAQRPGFGHAIEIAKGAGYGAVLRLAGGHAAVFHEDTLAFSWARRQEDATRGIESRFVEMVDIAVAALGALGVDARKGAVAGEYCPGEHSVNARGRTKLMGIGQRVIRGGAHVGGVVVIGGSDRVREILVPIYEALELEWQPETTGSVVDEAGDVTFSAVRDAFIDQFSKARSIATGELGEKLMARGESLRSFHEPLRSARSRGAHSSVRKIVSEEQVDE